jgi:2,3-bisphosphoglycerate-independent phosphoglycerate mutase
LIVTADHGNGDMNINPRTGVAHAEHTTSPAITIIAVPGRVGRFVCDAGRMRGDPERITIADIAPTVCGMLGLPVQEYMTGRPLGNLVVEVKHRRRM